MTKIAFCFLAVGNEHINEFNYISNKLSKFGEIFVCTDDESKINKNFNIIKNNDAFNYNLKRKSIDNALKTHDTIIAMDTDYYLINDNLNFSSIDQLSDGMYVVWIDNSVFFMKDIITIENTKSEYVKKLIELNDTNKDLFFIDECIFLLKISDKEKKNNFINNWNKIFLETEHIQPNNKNNGAMEGLIIYLSCLKSGIDVYETKKFELLQKQLNNFYHYSKENNKESIYNLHKNKII